MYDNYGGVGMNDNNKGNYRLVQEDKEFGRKVYYNFVCEGRGGFYDYDVKDNKQVSLAKIDSLTTQFKSEKDFLDHLKHTGFDSEEATMYITYNYKGENRLDPVFNSPTLQKIARSALGEKNGKVNPNDRETAFIFQRMFKLCKDKHNSLLEQLEDNINYGSIAFKSEIVDSRNYEDKTYSINFHSYDFIKDMRDKMKNYKDEPYYYRKFVLAFTSYKEFRALFLNCVEYANKKKKQEEVYRKRISID